MNSSSADRIRGDTAPPVIRWHPISQMFRRMSATRWRGGLCRDTKSGRLVTLGQVLEVPRKRINTKELDPVGVMKIGVLCPSAHERTA